MIVNYRIDYNILDKLRFSENCSEISAKTTTTLEHDYFLPKNIRLIHERTQSVEIISNNGRSIK